jgi:elongation factor G
MIAVISGANSRTGSSRLVAEDGGDASEDAASVSTLRGMTKGRAQYSMTLERYEVVPPNIQTEIVSKVKAAA